MKLQLIEIEEQDFFRKIEEAAYNGYKKASTEQPTRLITQQEAKGKLHIGNTALKTLINKGKLKLVGTRVTMESLMAYVEEKSCKK